MASTLDLDLVETYLSRLAGEGIAVLARYYRRAGEQADAAKSRDSRTLYASIREAARRTLVARGVEL